MKEKSDYETDSEGSSTPDGDNDNSSEEDDLSEESDQDKEEVIQSRTVESSTDKDNSKKIIEEVKEHLVTFICNTLSNYEAKADGELSFEKGEMLTVTNVRRDGWCEAKNSDGIHGLVPSTFLKFPDHVNALFNEMLQSGDSKEIHHWNVLRSSLRKTHVLNTALQTFGSVGHPLGFRECMLGTLMKEEKSYTTEAFLIPKLSDSGLSFEDMKWEVSSTFLKPVTTVLEKVIQLVALRQITPPPSEYQVTSHHLHMCLHDGNKVLSNIHTTKASWNEKNPKLWSFDSKSGVDSSCLEERHIFIRSNKSFATLGILFELCVTCKKKDSPETLEMSCGWAFMRLLNDSGHPIKSKTKILKVHNSEPFTNYLDASIASQSSFQMLMKRNKAPRMVLSISSPKRRSIQQMCYLPSTMIGPVSSISLMTLYRKIISDNLLQRTSFDNADLIQSPFLSNFPRIFNEPDLTDFFHNAWDEKLKRDKHNLRAENKKLNAFSNLFMETVFLIMNSCSFPPYSLGNTTNEQERKVKLTKVMSTLNSKEHGLLALSRDLEFKPISVQLLSAYIV